MFSYFMLLSAALICRFQDSSNWISLSCHWIQVVSLQLCLRGIKIQYKIQNRIWQRTRSQAWNYDPPQSHKGLVLNEKSQISFAVLLEYHFHVIKKAPWLKLIGINDSIWDSNYNLSRAQGQSTKLVSYD